MLLTEPFDFNMELAMGNAGNGAMSSISSLHSFDAHTGIAMNNEGSDVFSSDPTLKPFNTNFDFALSNVGNGSSSAGPVLQSFKTKFDIVMSDVGKGPLSAPPALQSFHCNLNVAARDVSNRMLSPNTALQSFNNINTDIAISNAGNGTSSSIPPRQAKAPRQHSVKAVHDPRNVTEFREDQANWSWENLPEILYTFKPPRVPRQPEPAKMSYQIHGQFLRDLPILPDCISSDVEEFRVEAWMRLDRRVRLVDITQRMHPEFRIKPNALQQRGVRFRKAFNMLAWGSGNKKTLETEAELVNKMRGCGIDPGDNSTRGMTPGLICPALGEAGGRIALPEQYSRRSSAPVRPAPVVGGDAGDGNGGVVSLFEEAIAACLWKAVDEGAATPPTIFSLSMEAYVAHDKIMRAMGAGMADGVF
ncbi:hypothetical protein DTO271G3_105 [Paecilomyces variotii]|nr:hypothetical protein DTO271G3_105 [Paecilomyces variotii]